MCRLTPGRRAWVAQQVRNSADMLGFGPLVARCDEQLQIERAVASKLRRWERAVGDGKGRSLARLLRFGSATCQAHRLKLGARLTN